MISMRLLLPFLFTAVCINLQSQEIKVYDTFDDFEELMSRTDKVYVLNFWATWCAPCIKELPYFEALGQKYDPSELEVILVSIDFKNQLEKRLKPFVKKKELQSQVVHLADPKPNKWIDRVDESWSGAIPATYVYSGDKHKFYEQEFHSIEELENIIKPFLK